MKSIMTSIVRKLLMIAAAVTVAVMILWQATGGDFYTKYEVVEQVPREIDDDDPFAAAGFYDGDSQTETTRRDEFRFGLLPTPEGIFDKHAVSVISLATPPWLLVFGAMFWTRRKQKRDH